MSILESLGTNEAAFAEATGTSVTASFELLPSGVYPATIKSVLTYTNQYGGQMMRYIVNITEQDRDLEFRQDIGAALKPDANGVAASNIGYTNRIKQFCYAAGVELDSLSLSPTTVKIKSYGKEYDAKQVQGMTGKSVLALVRYSQDTEKADGESYQFRNDIEGVCATNGLDASGENAQEIFMAKVEKNPIFKFKGAKPKAGTATATPAISGADKAALASLI